MIQSTEGLAAGATGIIEQMDSVFRRCESVYLKKLALNDWQWVENSDAHQGGFYIPKQQRDCGFFPALESKTGPKGGKVREVSLGIEWMQRNEAKVARLVNYPSKGEETHLTGIPKHVLIGIPPSSTLVMGKLLNPTGAHEYGAFVIHAETPRLPSIAPRLMVG